jgi:hypothetical protein
MHRYSDHPPLGNLDGDDTAGNIGPRHQPAPKYIPGRVGIGRHRNHSHSQLALSYTARLNIVTRHYQTPP